MDRLDLEQAAWEEAPERYFLEDGFALAPHQLGSLVTSTQGWNIYAPGCGAPFAWAYTLVEAAEKIELERRERLWTRPVAPKSAALWLAILHAALAQL